MKNQQENAIGEVIVNDATEVRETKTATVTAKTIGSWLEQSGRIIGSGILEEHEKTALTELGLRVKEGFMKNLFK